MKKITIISSIVIILCVFFLAFTQTQTTSIAKSEPQNVVKFHVSGCDDCSNLTYCIDGSIWGNPGCNAFSWDNCSAGNHWIFVSCSYGKSQIHYFYCQGSGLVQDEYITVISNGPSNPCQDKK